MKIMECRSCTETLTAYLDKELGEQDSRAVESHLATCTGCLEELRSLETACQLTNALPHLAVAPHLWDRIAQEVAPLIVPEEGWLSRFLRAINRPWIPLAAAAAAVVIIAGVLIRPTQPSVESDFAAFIQQREQISIQNTQVLFGSDSFDSDQRARNPFVRPVNHSSRSPFQE